MWLELPDPTILFVAIVVLSGITASTVVVVVRCPGAMLISLLLSQGTHRIARSRSNPKLTIAQISAVTASVLASDRTIVGKMLVVMMVVMIVVTVVMIEMIAVIAIKLIVTVVVTVLEMIVPRLVVRAVRPRIARGQPIVVPRPAGQMYLLKSMKPRLKSPC